jgi:predicted nucleic acid-binding protein
VKVLYVADASAVAALFLPDEGGQTPREVFGSLGEAEALSLWPQLQALGLRMDDRGGPGYGRELFQFAHSHGLSAYDAAYFELAARRAATLISLDEELRRAAEAAGVAVLPVSLKA